MERQESVRLLLRTDGTPIQGKSLPDVPRAAKPVELSAAIRLELLKKPLWHQLRVELGFHQFNCPRCKGQSPCPRAIDLRFQINQSYLSRFAGKS